MYQGKKFLAVITARGGSKGIPRKNVKDMAGKPLIAYTIEAALKSKLLDRVIVSTDDQEIAAIAKAHGVSVPFMRPAELSTDKAKSIPVVQHAVQWLKDNEHIEFDYVLILQPTSPLRTAEDIDACSALAVEKNADSVMSMYALSDFSLPKLKRVDEEGKILPYLPEYTEGVESAARHDLSPIYKRNCAVYLTKIGVLLAGDLFGQHSYAYVMPEDRSVDINSMFDWCVAEALLKHQS